MEENITIEFVRNWIEKHHLTRKSYESVLTDALTNNGHYYIDNPYLRDWIRENTEMFRNILSYELNENQQVVLTWLKRWHDDDPYFTLSELYDSVEPGEYKYEHELDIAYEKLSEKERFQVLAAFAEWGMKEVAE